VGSSRSDRRQPFLNGAMVALGVVAVVDNVVSHWILGLHRAVPGPAAAAVEASLVVLGVVLVTVGLVRETRQRRLPAGRTSVEDDRRSGRLVGTGERAARRGHG
jgi:uncharacterized membrane protein